MPVFQILILIAVGLVFIQDIRTRTVYWLVFPLLAVSFGGIRLLKGQTYEEIIWTGLINLLFLTVQFLLVTIYFSIKNRKWTNITEHMIGWGDILFLVAIVFYLSTLSFILFYILSLICSLLIWLCWQSFTRSKNLEIPLAGLQAILLTIILANSWWGTHLDLTNDYWALKFIN